MRKFKWICASVVILMVALALGCGANPGGAIIQIDNFSFGPATITIPAGSTVTWTNHDDVPHVVTSDDNKLFKSSALDTGDHFTFTFAKPGTYSYYCAIHPKMTAKIVVQ